jgi:xyloglucan-specific exo-beta-1,4-glucanase
MQKKSISFIFSILLSMAIISGLLNISFTSVSFAQTYAWKNVAMGGTGFISGIITSKTQANLVYARTDVGGAYRWDNPTSTWIPLLDWNSDNETTYQGVLSLALDPQVSANLYMLAGTSYWNGGNTAILRSTDYGATFSITDVSAQFKVNGNSMGRQNGERLAVDPHNSNILFCGSQANGLWKSTNAGATWSLAWGGVTATTNANGINIVLFDPNSAVIAGATQTIFVFVSRTGSSNFYKSTDGGATFTAVTGATTTLMPQRAVIASDGNMYITYADAEGPWNPGTGQIQKYNIAGATWTNVTPVAGYPYSGISVDPANSQRLIASTINKYLYQYTDLNSVGQYGDKFYLSTNGGTSWTDIVTAGGIILNGNGIPWIDGHAIHWAGTIEFDPFNTAKAWVGSGNGLFSCTNVNAAQTTWKFDVIGIEESVAWDAVSITGGPLVSVIGDYDGFVNSSLTAYSALGNHTPEVGSNTGIAFAALSTSKLLRVGGASGAGKMYYSTDQGTTWTLTTSINGNQGKVAISADGTTFLHCPSGSATTYYSTNNGGTWSNTGLSITDAVPVADFVNTNKIYAYKSSTGVMYVSTNKGVSFAAAGSMTAAWNSSKLIRAVPGIEGDLWVANGDNGLSHSTNSGTSFTTIAGVTYCLAVGIGKIEPSSTYPTLYIWGTVGGVRGLFRSIDTGVSWVRVNDDAHEFGGPGNGNFVMGDMNVYGRVFMSTVGRGIVYGELSGPQPLSANAGTDVTICAGGSTTLNGTGSGGTAPYTFSWSPTTGLSSSTIYNPVASPASTTTYTLTVKDAVLATATDAVTVTVNSLGSLPVVEGFESATFPSTGWTLSGANSFTRNTTCTAATGSASMEAATFGNTTIGNTYELTTPYLSMPAATSTTLSFKYATQFYDKTAPPTNRHDNLSVYISTGCGGAFTKIWDQTTDGVVNTSGGTAGATTAFCPSSSVNDWDTETVDLSSYDGGTSGAGVKIKFVVTNGNGTDVFLDDINITNIGAIATPVTLLSFDGNFDGDELVKLNWNVTSETKMTGYKLLRTTNLPQNKWEEIGYVPSVNSGNNVQNYFYYDSNPPATGTIYYKLVSIDNDGSAAESKIISLTREEATPHLIAYPNPSDNSFNIEIKDAKESAYSLQLSDLIGHVIEEIKIPSGISAISIGQNLPAGIYFLRLKVPAQKTIKLIKQ